MHDVILPFVTNKVKELSGEGFKCSKEQTVDPVTYDYNNSVVSFSFQASNNKAFQYDITGNTRLRKLVISAAWNNVHSSSQPGRKDYEIPLDEVTAEKLDEVITEYFKTIYYTSG